MLTIIHEFYNFASAIFFLKMGRIHPLLSRVGGIQLKCALAVYPSEESESYAYRGSTGFPFSQISLRSIIENMEEPFRPKSIFLLKNLLGMPRTVVLRPCTFYEGSPTRSQSSLLAYGGHAKK